MATGTYPARPGGFSVKTGAQTLTTKQKNQVFTNLFGANTGFVPNLCHTGGVPAVATTDGTDATPTTTVTYIAQVQVPLPCVVTGISCFNGSNVTGNTILGLADATGVVVAATALTAGSGTDAYQRIAFTAAYTAAPGTYYVLMQHSSATARFNTHTVGDFRTGSKTGETNGTFTTITVPTTFTTAVGPIASLY